MSGRKRRKTTAPIAGGSSLLVIFTVLCLTVFAVLNLSTVLSKKGMSDKAAASVKEYYEAECKAEEVIAGLRAGNVPDFVEKDGEIYSFEYPVGEDKKLDVKVKIESEDNVKVLCFKETSTAPWENDDSLVLWDEESGN